MTETTYEEWRVTGQPGPVHDVPLPPYDFTWSLRRNPHLGDPEQGARNFVEMIREHDNWLDGPHLSRRTVTETDWEPA